MNLCLNILAYHNIADRNGISYTSISKELFKKHLNLLLNNGLYMFTKSEVYQGTFLLDFNKVLITFDDGYESLFYNVLPLLDRFNFNPVVFIPAGYIGKSNIWDFSPLKSLRHLSKEMLINMSKFGFIIGSHSISHIDLRKCERKALYREVCDSKKILEDIIGEEVYMFAYPFGLYNRKVIDAVKECGYKYAFATAKGEVKNPFAVERALVYFIDRSPLPLLKSPACSIFRFRNRIISSLSSLTPLYKRLSIRKVHGYKG